MRAIVAFLAFTFVLASSAFALDGAERTQIADAVASQISGHFYDNSRGELIATALREAARAGQFDGATQAAFADQLTTFLISHDRHFNVSFSQIPLNAAATPGARRRSADTRASNFGFRSVAVLAGNIGYIDLREFADIDEAGETATAALRFISHTEAVIFDLRHNEGGAPSMLQFLISHFLDTRQSVVISTFVSSGRAYPQELRSLTFVPAGSRPDTPLFVLISEDTGSAAEAFAYHLQAMRRATVVGEVSAGAGNPGASFYAGHGFSVFVSTSQTRSPITAANWEGVGVQPDIPAPAAEALDQALLLAYERMIAAAPDSARLRELQWRREWTQNALHPASTDTAAYSDLIGVYGERQIYAADGTLFYRFSDGAPRRLTPLGQDRFLFGDLEEYRLTIQRSGRRGRIVSLSLEQLTAPTATYNRTN